MDYLIHFYHQYEQVIRWTVIVMIAEPVLMFLAIILKNVESTTPMPDKMPNIFKKNG